MCTHAVGKKEWTTWRTGQVTQLVRDIRQMVRRVRPKAMLTAACAADLSRARGNYLQDGPSWLRAGLVDLVFVMNYSKDTRVFQLRQEAWQREVGTRPLAAGIGQAMQPDPEITSEQLHLAGRWGQGFCLFSYTSLFNPPSPAVDHIRPLLLQMRERDLARARAKATASRSKPPPHPYGVAP